MLFTDSILDSIKDDPIRGALLAIQLTRDHLIDDQQMWHDSDHEALLEAYGLLAEMIDSGLLDIEVKSISLTGAVQNDCASISQWLHAIEETLQGHFTEVKLRSIRAHYKTTLGTGFHYEFSQGDVDRVQELLNQLRDLVSKSSFFEKDHQRRLLKRLESLQAEVHKRVSDLDRFWGLIGDAGVAIGKFGKDAKPIVDRIKEIADIVWRTQSRAEELPSSAAFPLLDNKNEK